MTARGDGAKLLRMVLTADPYVLAAASHTVNAAVVTAIYGERLPAKPLVESAAVASGALNQLATAIVVKSFGGTREESGGLGHPRLLVRCYGPSPAVARALALLVDATVFDETFDVADGPTQYRLVVNESVGPNAGIEDITDYIFSDMIYSTSVM